MKYTKYMYTKYMYTKYTKYLKTGDDSTKVYDLLFLYFKQYQITTVLKRRWGLICCIDLVVSNLLNEPNSTWYYQASPHMAFNIKKDPLSAL